MVLEVAAQHSSSSGSDHRNNEDLRRPVPSKNILCVSLSWWHAFLHLIHNFESMWYHVIAKTPFFLDYHPWFLSPHPCIPPPTQCCLVPLTFQAPHTGVHRCLPRVFFGPAMLVPHGYGHAMHEVEHALISRCKMAATLANLTANTLQKRKMAGHIHFPHWKSATDRSVGSVL